MGISRATQAPTHVHRNLTVSRLRRHDINQIRCIWWWGKKSRSWFSQQDDMEEHFRRQQALMMHRYTKAMRRRSLWDRDNSAISSRWGSCKPYREMSSTDPLRAKIEDRLEERKTDKQTWHEFHKDFESFKKAVDRAMERDAYGTLFGRRLRSPDTANNSSWTSWSWIFDPKEIKLDPTPETTKPGKKTDPTASEKSSSTSTQASAESAATAPSVSHSSSSSKTTSTIKSSQSIIFQDRSSTTTEYIYDPISGRKILQTQPSSDKASHPPQESKQAEQKEQPAKKSLVRSLFSENGTPVAVKLFKPKVYGFTGEVKQSPKVATSPTESFGASRKNLIKDLRWRTIGNNIDSTNFNCEPWNNKIPEAEPVADTTPIEETPLFAGTTYETKSDQILATHPSVHKDDFRAKQGMTIPSLKPIQPAQSGKPERVTKIEPALDRNITGGVNIPVKKFVSKLESAVDRTSEGPRLQPATDRIVPLSLRVKLQKLRAARIHHENAAERDKREDVDLLRASDVRANTKSTRITKQATEDKKQQVRSALERQFEKNAASDKENSENVWKHVKHYPNGIVARTMRDMGLTESAKSNVSSAVIPKFSEPTVRPDVVRNLAVERYTQVVEPQVAAIVDKAKSVKRELHDVKLTIGDVINQRAIAAIADRDLVVKEIGAHKAVPEITEPASLTKKQGGILQDADLQRSWRVVLYHTGNDDVEAIFLNGNARNSVPTLRPGFSPMTALGQLSKPSAFVKHFAILDKHGFELVKGSSDRLVFDKKQKAPSTASIKANIAAEEAAAQPLSTITARTRVEPLRAAEVLDQIPPTIPNPGPSAPTAPIAPRAPRNESQETPRIPSSKDTQKSSEKANQAPSSGATDPLQSRDKTPHELYAYQQEKLQHSSIFHNVDSIFNQPESDSKPRKSRNRISRQEEVFSGQRRLPPQTTVLPDPEHFQKQTPISYPQSRQPQDSEAGPGFFARLSRMIRRTFLTALALGAGAYGIGVIAEGVQAKAQIAGGEDGGPMKRVVFEGDAAKRLERQRAGIFSTESSR